jgi:N-acetylglucosaminyl-diphospho-decaprenol L-rhamnosyltransferase
MQIAAVVINYKSRDALAECLEALATGPEEIERVVVDNDSRDGSAEMLAARFPGVRLIANSENLGYSKAVNQGIAATRARFVLLMNPDCVVRPGAVRALADHLLAHPRTGIAGPQLRGRDGEIELSGRSFPTPITFLFNRYSLLTRLFPRNPWSRRYLLSDWDRTTEREVDWLSGSCLMARREAIDQVGGMDEQFFMFNEDVDWCRRMKLAGWAVAYVPSAVAVHEIGASKRRVAARVIWGRHVGMIHYFRKHHPMNPIFEALASTFIVMRAGLMLLANALRAR